jgi:hypothetical protein
MRAKDSATRRGDPLVRIANATDAECATSSEKAGATTAQSPEQPRDTARVGPSVCLDECWQQVFLPCVRRQHCIVHADVPAEAMGLAICPATSRTMKAQIPRCNRPRYDTLPINA